GAAAAAGPGAAPAAAAAAVASAPPRPKDAPEEPVAAPAGRAPGAGGEVVSAPLPGVLLEVRVKPGDRVAPGQVLCVLEAMKMENEVASPVAGRVAFVHREKGASVGAGEPLFTLES
ncbi:MAG: acetyl-CoA carboxylase biotin carboxyl carrier protein subunit, partial [Clostridia bacterium]|nr:acetyl-CoA carboxylase biotin carboxyl carrier protein subunit [Clostridia bacterium]